MTALRDNMSNASGGVDGRLDVGALFALESGWPDENDDTETNEESTDG